MGFHFHFVLVLSYIWTDWLLCCFSKIRYDLNDSQYQPPSLSAGGDNFQSHILKRGWPEKRWMHGPRMGGLKNLLPQIFAWGDCLHLLLKKTLWNKISLWGLSFKCWPVIAKLPIIPLYNFFPLTIPFLFFNIVFEAPFLVLHFSCYTLMTFLTMLSVILLFMLMILFSF